MTGQSELSWLALVPRDTVFIRDGRSFDAAADTSARTVFPWPSTIAGAVGAAFGAGHDAQHDTVPAEVRGPVLGRRQAKTWQPYFPAPLDLVQEAEARRPYAFRLVRTSTDETRTDLDAHGMRWLTPPRSVGRTKPLSGWMPCSQLAAYLAGSLAPGNDGVPVTGLDLEEPLKPELRVGLARDPGRRVRTGFLYQATHLRPEEDWGFLAGCVLRDGWDRRATGPVRFGGRSRMADVEAAREVSWPAMPEQFPGGRVVVYVATAALWPDGWRIPLPDGSRLVAAATGEPEPVATITPGRGWAASRALRWAVPAGSVYLLEFTDPQRAADWARQAHGTAYGRDQDDRLRTAGFGVVLTGVWT